MKYNELELGKYYKISKPELDWFKNYKQLTEQKFNGSFYVFTFDYVDTLTIFLPCDFNFIERIDRWKDRIKE